jgi:prepilin-type N-terminal cleavage/methylation domain-containing protein/prepilin-type processing-associated H-X9-DG protein
MQIPKNKKLSRAFTLVELLVVISVIGLLMGILVPALGRAKRTAYRTYCMANLKQIGVGFRAYLDDNRDIFPPAAQIAYLVLADTNNPAYRPPITKFLGPLLKEPKVFICKADTIEKYYLKNNCGVSYEYQAFSLGGRTLQENFLVRNGAKEKDIPVMCDFNSKPQPHPSGGKVGGINYLYADWHVSNYVKQE